MITGKQTSISEQARAIRWVAIGCIIAEYGARLLPATRGELKMRANAVVNTSNALQRYFLHHPNAKEEQKRIFKAEFSKNEVVLLAELLETVWGISEDNLEEIIKTLKENIQE